MKNPPNCQTVKENKQTNGYQQHGGIKQVINEVMHGRSASRCNCMDIVGDY